MPVKSGLRSYGGLRMMKGDTNYMAMLPCNYVAQEYEDELKVKTVCLTQPNQENLIQTENF